MSQRRRLAKLVAVGLVTWYVARAAASIERAPSHTAGRRAYAEGRFADAVRALDRAAADGRRAGELWYAGQAALEVYRSRLAARAPAALLEAELATADRAFTEAITLSPASGWYWAALSEVYQERERRARPRPGPAREPPVDEPLGGIGRDGRVALGALRLALAREPQTFALHDQLALLYFDLQLDARALCAVRAAAGVQPLLHLHAFAELERLPPGWLDAFAAGSRAALGRTPLLPLVDHHIALGRVELSRGQADAARAEFDAALASPHRPLQDAEARYHRSYALERLGRIDEARDDLARAGLEPVFVRPVLVRLAGIEERAGNAGAALGHLCELCRLDPTDVEALLRLTAAALRVGAIDEARRALAELERVAPERVEIPRLRREIDRARRP